MSLDQDLFDRTLEKKSTVEALAVANLESVEKADEELQSRCVERGE